MTNEEQRLNRVEAIFTELRERKAFVESPDTHKYQVRSYETVHCTDALYHNLTDREIDFLKNFNKVRIAELELELKKLL